MHPAIRAFLLELGMDPDNIDQIEFSWDRHDPNPAELTIRLSAKTEDINIEIRKVL